jgi:dihydrolipoamide dehydrogenase
MTIRLTIIGSGPGGYVAAIRAAQKGAQVTVVEDSEVGGVCLNRGCIPTKTIIASVETLALVRRAEAFGIDIPGKAEYNLTRIRERKDNVVSLQVNGIRSLFKSWGVVLIEGRGSLISANAVRVLRKDGLSLDIPSDRIIIATGSNPARLPGFPFDAESVITSDEAVGLEKIPRSLLIVGAGYIGCEFAFIYRSLGSDVSMVEMMSRALSNEDEDIAGIIEREFKKTGIKLLTNQKIESVAKDPEGLQRAKLSNGNELAAEMILVSIGRSLNSAGLGLDDAGVKTGKRGEIIVNDRMETTVPGIYAIGDVTGKIMLAHVASRQGTVAVENALGNSETMDYKSVPSAIFTMPEIGSVGLREHEARGQGIKYSVGKFPYRSLGKAHAMGEITGMVKVLSDAASDKVLGVHICGAHATDLIHEGVLAIQTGTTAKQLGRMMHAHPTLAEVLMEAAEDTHGRAIHKPKAAR